MVYRVNKNNSDIIFKLKELMDEKNISKNQMSKLTGFRFETIQGYYKGNISRVDLYVLSQFCKILECEIGDILEYRPSEEKEEVSV